MFEYRNDSRRSVYNGSVMIRISRYKDGECVGYLSRNIGEITPEKPKYRFPEGLHKGLELFGAWQLKQDGHLPLRIVYVVESPFTVMHFHQCGLPAVSPFGWAVTVGQCKILEELAKGCVYLPDADKRSEALGQAGTIALHLWCKMPHFPKEDPEDLTLEEIRALT